MLIRQVFNSDRIVCFLGHPGVILRFIFTNRSQSLWVCSSSQLSCPATATTGSILMEKEEFHLGSRHSNKTSDHPHSYIQTPQNSSVIGHCERHQARILRQGFRSWKEDSNLNDKQHICGIEVVCILSFSVLETSGLVFGRSDCFYPAPDKQSKNNCFCWHYIAPTPYTVSLMTFVKFVKDDLLQYM